MSQQIPLIPIELAPTLGDGEWVLVDDATEGSAAQPVRKVRVSSSEVELLKTMKEHKFPVLFFNTYTMLRGKGYEMERALCGAWYVLGPAQRPVGAMTQAQFAAILGGHRIKVLRHIKGMKPLLMAVRLGWWRERLVHLDDATYHAAVSERGTAADRKLAYQVAAGAGADVRIEPTGEAASNDYAELLAAIAAQEK
ncbi:MAG: hypothetical protein ACKN9T_18270 [Candidatus Methylumidiphilus sp.]